MKLLLFNYFWHLKSCFHRVQLKTGIQLNVCLLIRVPNHFSCISCTHNVSPTIFVLLKQTKTWRLWNLSTEYISSLFFFLSPPLSLQDPSSPVRDQTLAVKAPSPNHWTAREFPSNFFFTDLLLLKTSKLPTWFSLKQLILLWYFTCIILLQ